MNLTSAFLISAILVAAFFTGTQCVMIKRMLVPEVVKNGSEAFVILDCDFTYDAIDRMSLVVKWYFNSASVPIYQWIPRHPPQALGEFLNRLNVTYRASEDPYTMYRSLYILTPTTELSGMYSCVVSSFESEERMDKNMIVYAPASQPISISSERVDDDSVNVTCSTEGVYPEPTAVIHSTVDNLLTRLDNLRLTYTPSPSFRVTVSGIYNHPRSTPHQVVFECQFSISQANYTESSSLIYRPEGQSDSRIASSSHEMPWTNSGDGVNVLNIIVLVVEMVGLLVIGLL